MYQHLNKISHVSTLLRFIEKHDNGYWLYRGEDCDFGETKLTSSLYRGQYVRTSQNNGYYKFNTWTSFSNAMESFFKSLPYIDKNEERNFMALCQHHAISTPLLDISTSPLVGLYFAAQRSKHNRNGRLYIFDRNNFIPLDNKILSYDCLQSYYMKSNEPLNLKDNFSLRYILQSVNKFINNITDDQMDYIINLIASTVKELNLSTHLSNLINDNNLVNYRHIREYLKSSYPNDYKLSDLSELSKYYISYLRNVADISPNLLKKSVYVQRTVNTANILCFLIYLGNNNPNSLGNGIFVPSKLNLYTSCTSNWSRVLAQKSKFIMEYPCDYDIPIHHITKDPLKKVTISNSLLVHKPQYKWVFQVNNKKEILKELNQIGINEESLFLDKDHIADHISKRFYI